MDTIIISETHVKRWDPLAIFSSFASFPSELWKERKERRVVWFTRLETLAQRLTSFRERQPSTAVLTLVLWPPEIDFEASNPDVLSFF